MDAETRRAQRCGGENGKCKGVAPLSQVVRVVSDHQWAIAKHRDSNLQPCRTHISTVRFGTGDNRDNNLKRRGGHERRTTDLLRPDGLRDSGNVSRVGGEQIRLLDNSLNASVKWKV